MQIEKNKSLQEFNTFGLAGNAKYFAKFTSIAELHQILQSDEAINNRLVILGGGSNILITQNIDALVLKNELTGICITAEDDEYTYVESGSGESWHEFVMWTLENNLQGAENLSLIPGTVGAAPMQNIGAYGVEIKDIVVGLQALHIASKTVRTFYNKECEFAYRESAFKKKWKDEYIIINVEFKFPKNHQINISYGAIKEVLANQNIIEPSIKEVSNAVITIRQSKLPNPAEIGNAGSFFKNPEISIAQFQKLKNTFTDLPGYVLNNNVMKVPAGWLIEKCGWKGHRKDDCGVHKLQALVLVNYGNAKGDEILNLSTEIIDSVKNKFNIELEREVNIW
jgi:UDP-N-acetylmuramate dehydrogenase